MELKALKELTTELSLLYVEDDNNLREETVKLFQHLFNDVDSAPNGRIGLDMIHEKKYDIVVTDINMPVMNGIEFCKRAKDNFPQLPILITSAHDESHYLIELIDIGVNKFMTKPLAMNSLINTFMEMCSHLYNKKLLDSYKRELEQSNAELKQSNDELKVLVQILDTKIEQLNLYKSSDESIKPLKHAINNINLQTHDVQSKPDFIPKTNENRLLLFTDYLSLSEWESLDDLYERLTKASSCSQPTKSCQSSDAEMIADTLHEYAQILWPYQLFSRLASKINELSLSIKNNITEFITQSKEIFILLESFLYVLKKWKDGLFEIGVKNPNIYDVSMINDIDTMIILINNHQCEVEVNTDYF